MASFKTSTTLQRTDDRGELCEITFSFAEGMPDMLTVTQRIGGKTSEISFTASEASVFRYVLAEMYTLRKTKKRYIDDNDDDEDF